MKQFLIIVSVLFISSCNQVSDEDLKIAKQTNNAKLFINYERKLYALKDKEEYYWRMLSIQHNSGLGFGYYDPKEIKKDSMFLIHKENIHFVYQTYFNSLAFKTTKIRIDSEKFQDWCAFHQRLNEAQKDSIKKIFNFQIIKYSFYHYSEDGVFRDFNTIAKDEK